MPDLIGQMILNRFHVNAFLGKGGMAEVYKVWDVQRAVELAMKLLREDLAEDKVFLRRFKREAQTLSRLQHPYIVRCYGLQQEGDLAFILMDYVEGITLRKEIFRAPRPFSPQRVLEIMRPVCSALHYAHQMGLIHCDVKPANIMLHKNGSILLADFGIARMTESATTTMVGVGTPAYMAPEQVRGEDPTPQTDIYGLGIVLYEMLTGGERPFTGEQSRATGTTGEKVRWEHVHLEPPSPRQYNPDVSPELEVVVLKCLEKEPRKRFGSALEMFDALQSALNAGVRQLIPQPEAPQSLPVVDPLAPQLTPPSGVASEPRVGMPSAEKSGLLSNRWIKQKGLVGAVVAILITIAVSGGLLLGGVIPFKVSNLKSSVKGPTYLSPLKNNLYFTSDRNGKNEVYFWDGKGRAEKITNTEGKGESWDPASVLGGGFYFTSDRSGKREVYFWDGKDRAERVTNTEGKGESWDPAPVLRGSFYFISNREGKPEIYFFKGKGRASKITDTPGEAGSWGPAPVMGGGFYFTSNRDAKCEIYFFKGEGRAIRVTNAEGKSESWGPIPFSGGFYFTSDRSGKREIYFFSGKGRAERITYTQGPGESWSPVPVTGGGFYFTSNRDGKPEIYFFGESGKAMKITATQDKGISWTEDCVCGGCPDF